MGEVDWFEARRRCKSWHTYADHVDEDHVYRKSGQREDDHGS